MYKNILYYKYIMEENKKPKRTYTKKKQPEKKEEPETNSDDEKVYLNYPELKNMENSPLKNKILNILKGNLN